jgi:putative permease
MKRLMGYAAVVMATLTAVVLMWQFRSVIGLFLFSLAVAAAVRPLVRRLMALGLPRSAAVSVTYLVGLVLLAAALLLAGRQLLSELQSLVDLIASSYERAYPEWQASSGIQKTLAGRLPSPETLYKTLTGGSLGERALGLSRGFAGLAGGVFVVLSLSLYWTVDQSRFERLWLSVLPVSGRAKARDIWRGMEMGVGIYLRSEVLQSLVALVLLGLGYWALGLEFPLTLALLGAIFWLVPIVGVLLTIPPVFMGGLAGGLGQGLAAVLFTVTVLWLLEFVVEPRFFDRRRYSPILTVLLMLVLIEDLGIVGLVIAPPLAAALQSLAAYLLNPAAPRPNQEPAEQVAWLRERLAVVEAGRDEDGTADRPEIDSLVERLGRLIGQAERTVPPAAPGR